MTYNDIDTITKELENGYAETALALFEQFDNQRPLTLDVVHLKARILGELGRAKEAIDMLTTFTEAMHYQKPDIDTLKIKNNLYKMLGDSFWIDYTHYQLALIFDNNKNSTAKIERNEFLSAAMQGAIDSPNDGDALYMLAEAYLKTQHLEAGMVILTLAAECMSIPVHKTELYRLATSKWVNIASICELLQKGYPVILAMESDEDEGNCAVLAELLSNSDREVHLLLPPTTEDAHIGDAEEADIDSEQMSISLTQITQENIEQHNNLSIYRPIALYNGENKLCDNTPNVIGLIHDNIGFSLLLCETDLMDEVFSSDLIRLRGQRFTQKLQLGTPSAAAGYIGSYLNYIEHIHGKIVYKPLTRKSSVDISVVIPTRNNAYTLEYTLKTCLHQRVDNYEILVCDNSTPGNTETLELVERLNDPKIRYVHTPRDLNLTKSFEHAILNAEGDFIFTLGSDDGLPFHSLEVMSAVLEKLPESDVIQWDRGFYAWPDLVGSGQSGQFVIPGRYTKTITIDIYNSLQRMLQIFENSQGMYGLPMLYINSGFRRRYLEKVLSKTGRLWDGLSQDLYMGIVNLALNDEIPNIRSPLTIAGMCGKSIGTQSQKGKENIFDAYEAEKEYVAFNIGYCTTRPLEEYMAQTGIDISNFVISYLRVVDLKINQFFIMDSLQKEKLFAEVALLTSKKDTNHDLYMKQLLYSAHRHGNGFGNWFQNKVMPRAYSPIVIENSSHEDTKYTTGFDEDGALTLDAERFGVSNIFEACELFDKICNL